MNVVVYGADVVCASCVNAPSSKETYEWLQSILQRSFPDLDFNYVYKDIQAKDDIITDYDDYIVQQIDEDELFYPTLVINDEVVADGYIQYQQIKHFIQQEVADQS